MKQLRADEVPPVLHVIPLQSAVLFPGGVLPVNVAGTAATSTESIGEMGLLAVASLKNDAALVQPSELFEVATLARLMKFDREHQKIEVHGLARCRLDSIVPGSVLRAQVTPLIEQPVVEHANRETLERMRMMAFRIYDESPDRPPDMPFPRLESLNHLIDFVTANSPLNVQQKQRVLEAFDFETRLKVAQELWSRAIAKFPPVRIAGAACALHELPATDTCSRCGVFMCGACLMATTTRRCSKCRHRDESETMFTRLSRAFGFRS